MNPDNRLYFTFPGGARRAVTLSFDDGTVHDRRLVEVFNRHGLKATFNLVPGRLGRDGVVSRDEVASLYAGHEIASHGWMHLNLDRLDPYRRLAEIRDGRAALEDLLGRPVRGFASPFGEHGDATVDAMREAGVAYARTAGAKTVHLPRKTTVVDLVGRRVVARDTDVFSFDADLHSTHLFYYGVDAAEYLR